MLLQVFIIMVIIWRNQLCNMLKFGINGSINDSYHPPLLTHSIKQMHSLFWMHREEEWLVIINQSIQGLLNRQCNAWQDYFNYFTVTNRLCLWRMYDIIKL